MSEIKLFVTGGGGFIGKNIVEQLGNKYEILAPTRQELDLTDSEAVMAYLQRNPVDLVINAAAIGVKRTDSSRNIAGINLRIFFNLVRAKGFFKRMINLGSGAEYDKQQPLIKIKESDFDKHVPGDEYGFYKYVCAQYAAQVDYITHLRLFGVFGKYEDYKTRFISNAICRALLHAPITMRQNVVFDYIFIDDFVRILEKFILEKPKETFVNVGRGEAIDLKTIADKIITQIGYEVPVQVANSGLANEYSCDIACLNGIFPGISYTSIDSAIAQLIEYYRTILPNIDQQTLLADN